ncbi:MAG TPA: hypothetical protein VHL09_03460, partial [Dehalococcoidia bacterium]|nr:hypothetical protein [Dehalococcoidia bacterium]
MARASEWPAEAAGRSDGGADLTARVAALLESAGPDFLPRQRWFGSKAHRITGLRVVDLTPFSIAPDVAWLLAIIQVRYEDQPDEQYFVPVGVRSAQDLAAPIESGGSEILGVLPGGQTDRIVFDATVDPDFCRLLIRRLQRPQPVVGPGGSYAFRRVEAADPGGPSDAELPLASVERVRAEQSNTSVIYDRRLILKAFRRLAAGLNPDVEIGRFLTTATTFRNVPRVYGYFEYTGTAFEGSLGVVQDFVASRGDGWRYTLDCLEELCRRALGTAAPA